MRNHNQYTGAASRTIVEVGRGAHSEPILRYSDELHLPDHERARPEALTELHAAGYRIVRCPLCTFGHYRRVAS